MFREEMGILADDRVPVASLCPLLAASLFGG